MKERRKEREGKDKSGRQRKKAGTCSYWERKWMSKEGKRPWQDREKREESLNKLKSGSKMEGKNDWMSIPV